MHCDSLHMNIGLSDLESTRQLLTWFDNVWAHAQNLRDIKNNLIANWMQLPSINRPILSISSRYFICSKTSSEDIDEDNIIRSKTGLNYPGLEQTYKFQKDGVLGAIDKLEKHNSCIIADSVGLGKTFEALAVIKYYELRNDGSVLCPKKLRDNWTMYTVNDKRNLLATDRFNYDVLNHTDLTRPKGYSGEINWRQ
ncbi:SNF2-related protein [Escherichia coli]